MHGTYLDIINVIFTLDPSTTVALLIMALTSGTEIKKFSVRGASKRLKREDQPESVSVIAKLREVGRTTLVPLENVSEKVKFAPARYTPSAMVTKSSVFGCRK